MCERLNGDKAFDGLLADSNAALTLDLKGVVRYKSNVLAQLIIGDDFYQPKLILDESLLADAAIDQEVYKRRLLGFVAAELAVALAPITKLQDLQFTHTIAKEIASSLVQHQGIVPRGLIADKLEKMQQEARAELRKLGVRFGRFHVFLYDIIKPASVKILLMLWAINNAASAETDAINEASCNILEELELGRTTFLYDSAVPKKLYNLAGYEFWDEYAMRVDIAERLSTYIQEALSWRKGQEVKPAGAYDGHNFVLTPWALSLLGLSYDNLVKILTAMGYMRKTIELPQDFHGEVAKIPERATHIEIAENKPISRIDIWSFTRGKDRSRANFKRKKFVKVDSPSDGFRKRPFNQRVVNSPFAPLAKLRKELTLSAKNNNNKS
ncbi:MAG: hypothetical protein QWI73_00095 [Alphaproteobacteria bacterium]|nr:hypothetical protein [Alphaproteobacteria bacterium]